MREKLKQYVEQLFIGAPKTRGAQELKEEMLQNLLDKYDDLLAEGRSEADAYEAAIAGIGDVSGLIGGLQPASERLIAPEPKQKNALVLAAAITLYVLSVIPNFLFGNVFGVVLMFALVAAATAMLIMNRTNVHPARMALVGVGVALLIMSSVPTILIHNVLGVTLLFVLLGAGVGLIVYGRTRQFDAPPAEAADGFDADRAEMPRASKIGYAVLAAIVLLSVLGAALSASVWNDQIVFHGLRGEIIGGADEATEIVIGEDFGQRIEDRIDESIDDNLGEKIEDAVEGAFARPDSDGKRDDDKDADGDKKGETKNKKDTAAKASAVMAEGAAQVPSNGITEIEIEWVGGSVSVSNAPYDGDTIAISETSEQALTDAQKLRYTVKGNKLTISYCEKTVHAWDWLDIDRLSMPKKSLTVQMPAGTLPELEINGVSADIEVRGVAFDELDVESVSGDISVSDVTGRKLSVQTTSGKGVVSGADVTKLNLESTSGDMKATGSRASEVDVETISASASIALTIAPAQFEAETVSGRITLALPKDATDFAVELESVSGDFDCGFAGVQQSGRYVVGSGAYRYEFTSVSGDFAIIAG